MLSIAILAFYFYVITNHHANFSVDDLFLIALEVFFMMFAMAVGLYYMRAESGGKSGLFALAENIDNASSEERSEFMQKFRAARESLFSAGLFFCFLLILVVSVDRQLISSSQVNYQLAFVMPIPVIAALLLEAIFKFFLRLKAGKKASLTLERDPWLTWLGFTILGFLAVIWTFPYDESETCLWIYLSLPAAGIVSGILWIIDRHRKAAESVGGLS